MLQDAIKTIDKEIKDYEKEDKTNVLEKEGSSDLFFDVFFPLIYF